MAQPESVKDAPTRSNAADSPAQSGSQFDWAKTSAAINLAGSMASITGISLVWLKTTSPGSNLAMAVPVFLIASLFAVGMIAIAYLIFKWGYKAFAEDAEVAGKIAYVSVALGSLLIVLALALCSLYVFAMVTIYGSYTP